jgi:hypothetical protein
MRRRVLTVVIDSKAKALMLCQSRNYSAFHLNHTDQAHHRGYNISVCRRTDHCCRTTAQGVLAGQAVAGVAVSVLSFVTLWASPVSGAAATARSLALPAFLYFAAATTTMVACVVGYTAMWRWRFVQSHWGHAGERPGTAVHQGLQATQRAPR